MAAWGGVELLRDRHSLGVTAVTGPATDNAAGIRLIERETGVPAINARNDPAALSALVMENLDLPVPVHRSRDDGT